MPISVEAVSEKMRTNKQDSVEKAATPEPQA